MPQTAQGEAKPMSAGEIATLRGWIQEGAVYRPHWAFEVPGTARRSCPPGKARSAWVKTPIDNFILRKAWKKRISIHRPKPTRQFSSAASLSTSRVCCPLLPKSLHSCKPHLPMPTNIWWIVCWRGPPSASNERATGSTMPAMRIPTGCTSIIAATSGPIVTMSSGRSTANKPFDQFAMEQIAGDLLPMKNLDPLIGSGYVRLGVSSNEGGTITEELRVNIARERTEAFGASFMGLTVGLCGMSRSQIRSNDAA